MDTNLTKDQFSQMLNFAKANPSDPRSVELGKQIQAGAYNQFGSVQQNAPQKHSFLRSLVSAPATIIARPIQAIAELAGASSQQVDETTKKLTGGLVAPVPQNGADVKKDVGRAAETVALGLSPVAGGVAFGVGNSLEQGNDLFSVQTALQAALGAAGGKVLDLIGKPVFNTAGKAIATVTPQFLKDLAGKGTQAIIDFAAQHEILPEAASNAVNTATQKVNTIAEAPFNAVENKIKDAITKRKAFTSVADSKQIDTLAGTITQGRSTDIEKAKAALTHIDTTGIKTYQDLGHAFDAKIENLSTKLDTVLGGNTEQRTIDKLALQSKVGNKNVSHNYVTDALDQLEQHYTKVNDPEGIAKIAQLRDRAQNGGLTVQDINNLAKQHGIQINAFNANGEAASGLTKQAAENTRKGLKLTARKIFNNPIYQSADEQISNLIRVRDLVKSVGEKVTALEQRVTKRGFGEKVGRLVFKVTDKLTGGGLKGFVQSFVPRGEGLKIMNALDLERSLGKNLTKLQKALSGKTESEVEKSLQSILDDQESAAFFKSQPTTTMVKKTPKKLIYPNQSM